jgi:Mg-chelatase subunit ChlD
MSMTSQASFRLEEREARVRDRQKERLIRMTQVIQSFASGFTLRPISVKLVTGGQAPAFSSSDRIWFHEGMMSDLTTKRGVASLKGLTLHEISHILLTPRTGSELRQWVQDNNYKHAWNALEDQRIEAQIIAMYPSTRDWFCATMDEYLLKTPEQWSVAFPLIHGRKYLDPKVRKLVKQVYVNSSDVAELSDIIDRFRTLNMTDPQAVELAKDLIVRYHELTKGLRLPNPHGHEHRSDTEHETNANSKPWNKKQQKDASSKVEDEDYEDDDDLYDEVDSDDDYEDEPDSDEDGDSDGDDSDGDSEDGSDISDSAGSNGDSEEGGGDSEEETNTNPEDSETDKGEASDKQGKGAGAGNVDPTLEKALNDLLKDSLDETLERLDDKLANDIDLYNGDVLLEGETIPEPQHYGRERTLDVSASAGEASEQFASELMGLRAKYDPSWNYRTSVGRINPVRWEQGCEIEEAFDRFEMGREDATDIEAVILLDVSGSMSGMEVQAHESMWALKRALDSVNASTTVVAYSEGKNETHTIYSANERVGTQMRFVPNIGGTDPTYALQYAQGVLANSLRAIRLLIVITDGEWSENCLERTEETIRTLREGGVLTSLAWLSGWLNNLNGKNLHGAEIVSLINKPSDLFYLGRSIVEVGVQRQLSH